MSEIRLLYARPDGTLLEHPTLRPAGQSFAGPLPPRRLRPLPAGATLCQLPGCTAQGYDARGRLQTLRPGRELAVGALLPTGHARVLLPAYHKEASAAYLPLFGYTAVAAVDGELHAASIPIDAPGTWNPTDYNTPDLRGRVERRLAAAPDDPLLAQVARCALEYGCYTAQNIFYERWEGALPASPACAAQCVGCISEQLGDVPSPQERLTFAPTPEAMADLAVAHLAGGPGRMISFGQGCEGDPLNRWRHVAQAVRLIRERLPLDHPHAGVMNMNTNGWHTRGLREVADAGLQRIRISLFSAVDAHYAAYYKPRGYTFADVRRSLRLCADAGVHVALNLLTFPGYTDAEDEVGALLDLIRVEGVAEVQVRTLNIDRELLRVSVPAPRGQELGMARFLETLRATGVRVATHAWLDPYRARQAR
ncbi:MAG TPA: radical SAM protein [Chloroflexota bacterium]|nr:radical SAM protein [Chloroflexota bacterium]